MNNIKKLYLANFLTGVVFWYGIEKLFMAEIGINAVGVAINATVLLVVEVVFDVPSGVLADKWKRKYTLMLALLCLFASTLILGLSNTLLMYAFGSALFGGYVVLTSGTFQAIMYDSLHELGLHKKYDRYQGRAYALFMLGIAISSLAGGYIGEWYGLRAPYFASLIFSAAAFAVLTALVEPKFHKLESDSKLMEHIKTSLKLMRSSPLILHLSLLAIVIATHRGVQNEYAGLYYIALGLAAIPTGYANAAKWIASMFGQYIAERVGRAALRFVPVFYVLYAAFSLIESPFGMVFFYLTAIAIGILRNQSEAEIQDHTPSEIRATTLSVIGFASNIILVPLGLIFGYVTQQYSVYAAYQLVLILGLVYLLSWALRGRKAISL